MRADRLLSLLLLLQNRGRMTAAELATELEVSLRTVYRDVEALGAAGVPVRSERGPDGGYSLMNGYRTRLTGLNDAEAESLFLAGVPGAARELGLGAGLATAQLKLQAALPPGLAERARRLQDCFHLDAAAWFRHSDPVPHLASVARAVWEQRTLHVRYRAWDGREAHRELRPLGLVLKSGIWYAVAWADGPPPGDTAPPDGPPPGYTAPPDGIAPGADGTTVRTRTYRISRLMSAETTDTPFERPAGFDLAACWEASSQRLEARLHHATARLRISPRAQRLLPMQFGAAGSRALEAAGPADREGWVLVDLPVETPAVAVGDLLRLGMEAEVLGPPGLRAAVARTASELAERYAAP
ncbi:helix-turn-helix transcriptional regulator [Streptomyces monomycini]|uniref:helix-turn-helix transcriptional regulator n=1 Tax=Streptomyces monomycini TaxID=371720 RepID=UPI0004A9E254|nr:WYL domain-containing protein [Streptomyces monomycini]